MTVNGFNAGNYIARGSILKDLLASDVGTTNLFPDEASMPPGDTPGDLAITQDEDKLFYWNGTSWLLIVDGPSQNVSVTDISHLRDMWGRFGEDGAYTINRAANGDVTTIDQALVGGVTKTFTFNRDLSGAITSVNVANDDLSFNRTYTFVKDSGGNVVSITLS